MRLSSDEVKAFEAACEMRRNRAVEELFNALGVTNASAVLFQVATAPRSLATSLVHHVRAAIVEHNATPR
jgi:hypothetical protein